uniref:Uncharacterized protein n=1 Tax=Coccolithus braarudii TaxID=221442 RepID=A0A6T7DD87_9EUKA
MSEGAMPDLAGEVVAQLEKLHDADRSPLQLACRGVTLSVKQKGARLMYVLQLAPTSRGKQTEVFFDLANVDDAIILFVAKILDGKHGWCLDVRVQHENGEKLASEFLSLETDICDVAQSKVGSSLRGLLNTLDAGEASSVCDDHHF